MAAADNRGSEGSARADKTGDAGGTRGGGDFGNHGVFALTQLVDAPREKVFAVWTKQEHLNQWFGPKGVKIVQGTFDMRPGGVCHYCMRGPSPDASEMWGKWVVREVVAPERLVFVVSFSDPAGNIARAPFDPNWPLETLSTITFADQGGRTLLTVRWEPINATPVERDTFAAGMDGMQKGWSGTLERLAEYLGRKK